ncbi:MAG: response regulator [Polyangiaceae bacterium]
MRDTGGRVDPSRLPGLFDAFTQADASTTRKYGGTGLGLANVRRLAELMNGELFATSEPGNGSTFGFVVPLPHAELERPSETALAFLDGARVLVVVSHESTRAQISRIIQQCGGIALPFGHADEIRFSPELPPAIAVLDAEAQQSKNSAQKLGLASARTIKLVRSSDSIPTDDSLVIARPVRARSLKDVLRKARDLEPSSRPVPSPFSGVQKTASLRILLAEDNPVNQRVAQMMLARLGHHVDVVSNGREAVTAIKRDHYDVLITDIQMPEMDGLEAARTIRASVPADRQPRIIAMTASAFDDDRRSYEEAGMDDFISKPVVLKSLTAALVRASEAIASQAQPNSES